MMVIIDPSFLIKAHSKFPEDRFMIINDRYLKVRKMSADEVGKKIAAHCKGSEMFLAVKVTKENIEKTALGILKAMRCKFKKVYTISGPNFQNTLSPCLICFGKKHRF